MPELRFPQVIDNTMRSDFVLCPHKWFRRHCQGLAPRSGPSIHLHFGACFASGLEATRKAYHAGTSPDTAVITGCQAALRAWGDFVFEPRSRSEEIKTQGALIDALSSYFEHYPLASDAVRILDLGSGPLVERSFAVPIPATMHPVTREPIIYAGRCDMVGRIGEGTWIIDEKTSSRLGDGWIEKWNLAAQPTGYCWGFRSYGIEPVGAIMRGVGIYTSSIGFAESIQPRATWQIDQWLRQLGYDVRRMIAIYNDCVAHGDDNAPRNLDHACNAYNKPCLYTLLCNSPRPDNWLGEYDTSFWDPLTLREEIPC